MIDACIAGLLRYAENAGLIEADDRLWARNRLLEALQLDGCDPDCAPAELPLADLLRELTEDAVSRGVAQDNSVARDLFDTKLMGVLTPAPHEVRAKFRSLYAVSPEQATDWFYAFSQNTNYIRRDRIARDQKWVYESLRSTGHHDQPLQAGEGPARHCGCQARAAVRLSQVRSLRRKRGLCRTDEPPGPPKPPRRSRDDQRQRLVSAVFAVCLL